jgi:hypothetical protein
VESSSDESGDKSDKEEEAGSESEPEEEEQPPKKKSRKSKKKPEPQSESEADQDADAEVCYHVRMFFGGDLGRVSGAGSCFRSLKEAMQRIGVFGIMAVDGVLYFCETVSGAICVCRCTADRKLKRA